MRVCGCVGVCAETSYAFSVCLWIRSTAANKPQGTGNTSHAPNHTHTHHTLKGRVLHGLRKGSMSFLRTVTLETVHTSQKVTRCVASALDHNGALEETLVRQQPADIREGLKHARTSLSRGMKHAANAIVVIPMKEYQRSGPKGAMTSVIRAVPVLANTCATRPRHRNTNPHTSPQVAVLQPVLGASEALSYTLLGIRNSMSPDIHQDEKSKFMGGGGGGSDSGAGVFM